MKLIRAALGRDLDNAASVTAKFRTDVVGRDSELLDYILSWDQRVDIVFGDIGSDTVNEEETLPLNAPPI